MIDTSLVDVYEVEVKTGDYPDFADSYIVEAYYKGEPMTDAQLDELNEDADFVYEACLESL